MAKQRNDATASAQGLVFQFMVALDACFQMKSGEAVYIEKFGDVTTVGDDGIKQIEAKKRQTPLGNGSDEIWNTIYNWLIGSKPLDQYSKLILCTTQPVSNRSHWAKWNKSDKSEKCQLLRLLIKSIKKKKQPKYLTLINILKEDTTIDAIASKLIIVSSSASKEYWYEKLDPYAITIPKSRRQEFFDCLLGYVVSLGDGKDEWVIKYNLFTEIVADKASNLIETTAEFPSVSVPEFIEDCNSKLFISKLKEIDYDEPEVIADAIEEYTYAMTYYINNSTNPFRLRQFSDYSDEIHRAHRTSFRKARIGMDENDDIIKSSQLFYESFRERSVERFGKYNNTPNIFRNGVVQILADDDIIGWHLGIINKDK